MGIECMVVAPSLIPTRPGDRVKTDRRDAAKLARLLRSGDLTPVWVPDEAHEALRDLVRDRDDAKQDLLRAKHRLSKFLLRHGIHPPAGVQAWSRAHEAWLNRLALDQRADQVVFDDYWSVVRDGKDRVRRLEAALVACAAESPHGAYLAALQALRGIGFITAVTIVAEAGDLRRFPTARAFMAYTGLVPSEYSSGTSRHRGRITKTGNRLICHVLGQAAHNARYRPNVSSALRPASGVSRRRSSSSTGGPRPGSTIGTARSSGGSARTRPSSPSPASSPASSGRRASSSPGRSRPDDPTMQGVIECGRETETPRLIYAI